MRTIACVKWRVDVMMHKEEHVELDFIDSGWHGGGTASKHNVVSNAGSCQKFELACFPMTVLLVS